MIDIEKTIYDEFKTWSKDAILAMINVLNTAKMGYSAKSGTLANSEIKKYLEKNEGKITAKQGKIIYELVLPEYAKYVETGRKAGKMPPSAPIEKWMRRKGIDKKFSYPIRRSIGEKGLQATNFMQKGFWDRESILMSRLEEMLAPLVQLEIITYAKLIGYK